MKGMLSYRLVQIIAALIVLPLLYQCKSKTEEPEAGDKPGSFTEPIRINTEPPKTVPLTTKNSFLIKLGKDKVWYKADEMIDFAEVNPNTEGQIKEAVTAYRNRHKGEDIRILIQQNPDALYKTFEYVTNELKAAGELKYFLVTGLTTENEN
jgi:biopolymer transport protein ExbD